MAMGAPACTTPCWFPPPSAPASRSCCGAPTGSSGRRELHPAPTPSPPPAPRRGPTFGSDPLRLPEGRQKLGAAFHLHFSQERRDVELHRLCLDAERGGDLFVGAALEDLLHHLDLAPCELPVLRE